MIHSKVQSVMDSYNDKSSGPVLDMIVEQVSSNQICQQVLSQPEVKSHLLKAYREFFNSFK